MITVRCAEIKDSETLFDWRNDPVTRSMSHSSHCVEWDDHNCWFRESLNNKNRLLVLCEDAETLAQIAVVRFDRNCTDMKSALISITLAPKERGKGYATPCLLRTIEFFHGLFVDVRLINAQVKSCNIASKRAFEKAGFLLIKQEKEILYYQYQLSND